MADELPGERIPEITIKVDPEFQKMVDELMTIAHKIKSERIKLEMILGDIKQYVDEFRALKDA